jgi:hypothetical protein
MLKRSLTALLISAFACAILNAQEHSRIHQPTLTPQNSGTTNGLIAVWPVNPQVVYSVAPVLSPLPLMADRRGEPV